MFKFFGDTKKNQDNLLWVQSISFAIFYSFLYYPQTNFLSDLCLIIGALCGVYIIACQVNIQLLTSKYAVPIWLILGLFIWVTVHLIFFSQDYAQQLREFESIWKRALIASIFALGFGLNLCNRHRQITGVMWLIYAGLMGPAFIYLFKFALGLAGNFYGITLPEFLRLFGTYQESMYSVYKAVYVAFWLPAFAVSLSQILVMFEKKGNHTLAIGIFSICAFLCIYAFYLLGSKNGIANSIIIFLVFYLLFFYKIIFRKIKLNLKLTIFIAASFLVVLIVVSAHLQKYRSWEMLVYDAKVGLQIDRYDHWKYSGKKGYPENDLHTPVTNTNYERVAWAVVGINLIGENPLGYGLVERSFAALTKKKWPESELDQSHSAWIDLTLGLGWIGISLILAGLITAFKNLTSAQIKIDYRFNSAINLDQQSKVRALAAGLFATSLCWLTAEICQKNQLILLICWIVAAAGFSMGVRNQKLRFV